MNREPKEGELYRLKDGDGWCRHGIVLIQRNGERGLVAVDTYWGGGPNNGALERNWYPIDDALKARLTFMLDMTNARECYDDEYSVYADEDRAYIPIGGSKARWFVRKDAKPNYPRQVAQIEQKIAEQDRKAEWAADCARRYREDLQKLKDSVVHRPKEMGACREDCTVCREALAGVDSAEAHR